HHHLHGSGDRYRPTAVDNHLDLGVVERGAVQVGRVRAEQTCLPDLLDLAVLPVASDADVGRYAGTGLPGQLPVVTGHLEVGELGTGSRQGQGEALVFAREVLGGTAYEPALLTLLPLSPPREPVGEHGLVARVVQGLDCSVCRGGPTM